MGSRDLGLIDVPYELGRKGGIKLSGRPGKDEHDPNSRTLYSANGTRWKEMSGGAGYFWNGHQVRSRVMCDKTNKSVVVNGTIGKALPRGHFSNPDNRNEYFSVKWDDKLELGLLTLEEVCETANYYNQWQRENRAGAPQSKKPRVQKPESRVSALSEAEQLDPGLAILLAQYRKASHSTSSPR